MKGEAGALCVQQHLEAHGMGLCTAVQAVGHALFGDSLAAHAKPSHRFIFELQSVRLMQSMPHMPPMNHRSKATNNMFQLSSISSIFSSLGTMLWFDDRV